MNLANEVIQYLLDGDVSIRYQVYRDLLDDLRPDLQAQIQTKGWGKQFLDAQAIDGHWGNGWYAPKWACTHYKLLILKNMQISPEIVSIRNVINRCLDEQKCADGGFSFWKGYKNSDVCVNGMILNYAAYFLSPDERFNNVIDHSLSALMPDGGWNCRYKHGATHSSFHTTLSILEGLWEYRLKGGTYRLQDITKAEDSAIEFLLKHHLYLSSTTGKVVNPKMTLFSYPCHWHYDVLKALVHLVDRKLSWDERLREAITLLCDKKDERGFWNLQNRHEGKMLFHMEKCGSISRWNTLRAYRVLRHFGDNI